MRDVSFIVGGLGVGLGVYASTLSAQGDIDTQGAHTVLVENYSSFVLVLGNEIIPPMWRRIFAVDDYPNLKWKMAPDLPPQQSSIGSNRTVRVILDPYPPVATDGPVYPNPIPVTFIHNAAVGQVLFIEGVAALVAATTVGGVPSLQVGQIRDVAIVGISLVGTGLDTHVLSAEYHNNRANPNVSVYDFQFYKQTVDWDGKDWSFSSKLPGPDVVTIAMAAAPTRGSMLATVWIGFHL